MTAYHADGPGLATGTFLPADRPVTTIELGAADRLRKTPDDRLFTSQRDLLAGFDTEVERFREAPKYDFARPPHPGELHYERLGWSITGEIWRRHARAALEALGLRSPTMGLTVLNVAYVFAPVGPDTAGGAEQVLAALDRALVAEGHRSLVIACAGSKTAGELLATAPLPAQFNEDLRRRAQRAHGKRIEQALRQWPVDLVHCHGHDFAEYLPDPGVPTLVTLHLPVDHYPPDALSERRPGRYFNCVSASQRREFPGE